MSTIPSLIEARLDDGKAVTFVARENETVGRRELWDDATRVASALATLGVGPGGRVAVLAATCRPTATLLLGVWVCGASVAVLPPPYRIRDVGTYVSTTNARIAALRPDLVVLGSDYAPFADAIGPGVKALSIDDVVARAAHVAPTTPSVKPDDLAIVQFSSGSTGEPRPLALTHSAVTANIRAIQTRTKMCPDDTFVTWLPLFHDMGLIGTFAVPLATGTGLAIADTSRFVTQPSSWMRMLSENRATICCGPNSAYVLATRTLSLPGTLDLSPVRLAFNGAEPIQPADVRAFLRAGKRHGLRSTAASCVYGLAEATLAVSLPHPETGIVTFPVDRDALERQGVVVPTDGLDDVADRELVSLGTAVPGMEVRVGSPASGHPHSVVGDVWFRGPSHYAGILKDGDLHPVDLVDGWVPTGDVGATVEGQLVLCGRQKDIIIVGGRNIHPDQVEHAVSGVPGVRSGNVAAFGVPRAGTEGLVVFAETRSQSPSLKQEVVNAVLASTGMVPVDVCFLEPGQLPKTSSGKVRRQASRQLYFDGSVI